MQSNSSEVSSDWGPEWERIADVVVVGSGAAACAAAATAAREGSSVIMLEKFSQPGGTTGRSSGTMWIPGNHLMHRAGYTDSTADALAYMARLSFPTHYNPAHPTLGLPRGKYLMLETFLERAPAALQYLVDCGAIALDERKWPLYPDFHADLEGDGPVEGRSIRPLKPDNWRPEADPPGGQYLVDKMCDYVKSQGGELLLNHRAAHLIRQNGGRVIGVEARRSHETRLVGARKGVVFGTGGFLHDPALALEFLRGPIFGGCGAESATGDFIRIASEAGALLGNMSHAWWIEVVLESTLAKPATVRDVAIPFGDSMMIVNRFGRRVMNEKMPYNERGQVHFHWDAGLREYPNLLLFMIYDQAVASTNVPAVEELLHYPVPLPGQETRYVIDGDTLEQLVHAVSSRLAELSPHTGGVELASDFHAKLVETIKRFNGFAGTGTDEDFRRGATPIEQAWATRLHDDARNRTMYPLADTGPYHCIILAPGALDTKGGPLTDEKSRVLSAELEPIPGLYGAGNCVASPSGQGYWGAGATIGPALAFGHIAGLEVSQLAPL